MGRVYYPTRQYDHRSGYRIARSILDERCIQFIATCSGFDSSENGLIPERVWAFAIYAQLARL
jgi:hypothetical protein